ncbi:DMT family transporter [Tabrizicola fusiformis]|uniref:DMT family transporter n=1 Tax=Tabrizicola sp. SY72 TaxID=2741673 RepID=UPI0015722911|nr:DMT family transporter [Tabrizicola sp. SY72]NTT85331.1 DMT family transporter [Tabrizicola sp. SY72]
MTQPQSLILRGIALKLASVLLFVAMQALIKQTAARVPPGEAMAFRSAFAIPVILLWLVWQREFRLGLRPAAPFGHLWRGVMGGVSMGLGFAGLGYLPLPEVTAIGYAAPLLTVIFAAMFLDEKVPLARGLAVLAGFGGVLLVLTPRLSVGVDGPEALAHALGAMLVLGSAVFAALAQVFVRKLLGSDRTPVIVFWFSVTSLALSLVTLPFGWVVPGPGDALALVLAGVVGGAAQILLTTSYRHADASVVAPFDYASMLVALLVGFFVFQEAPGPMVLAGAAVISAAGLAVIWQEHRRPK